jgi:hypothetical protein
MSGFWQWRGDFDLRDFAARLPASFELHFLCRIDTRGQKYDRGELAVNADVVPRLIEISSPAL